MAGTEMAINMLSMNVHANKGENVNNDDHAFKFKIQISLFCLNLFQLSTGCPGVKKVSFIHSLEFAFINVTS